MKLIFNTIMLAVILGLTACGTESTAPDSPENELATEGKFEEALWVLENDQLPTPEFKQNYERMEFYVDENLNYTWTWVGKGGHDTYTFKGETYYEKSSALHTSGSAIYTIAVYVATINGKQLPGSFYGIYTYEDENHMTLNVEPGVSNWGVHPTADLGLGSGESGNKSVYTFTKQ